MSRLRWPITVLLALILLVGVTGAAPNLTPKLVNVQIQAVTDFHGALVG